MQKFEISNEQMIILGLIVVWELIWKGFALWRAARNNHQGWFITLIALNTIGLLPIIYILTSSKADAGKAK